MSSPNEPSFQWLVTQRGRQGEPRCTLALVDGQRVQVYRHIAHPQAWTAYSYGLMADIVLTATSLDEAQQEALVMLEHAQAKQRQSACQFLAQDE